MQRGLFLLALLIGLLGAAVVGGARTTEAQATCFQETGFCINNPAFLQYFNARGGVRTFGYPISREFTFLGFRVQFFQGHIMQLQPNGSVATMNLLQEGLMPVTRVNGSTFPAEDPALTAATPSVGDPNYAERIVDFIRQNAPNEFNGRPVRFFDTFINTVDLATAFPGGGGNPALVPLLNLEIWGAVTSRPMADPNNAGFIYQRYQRSIMHYRDVCQCTERILLANWFKTVITGDGLPPDLAEDMANSPFIRQWNPNGTRWMNRPDLLPNTDLTNAFVPDLPGYPTPPAATGGPTGQPAPGATATPQPTGAPTVTVQLSDDRIDPGEEIAITVIAHDDDGLRWIRWEGEPRGGDNDNQEDPELADEREFDCDGNVDCANVWRVSPSTPGRYNIVARARDVNGNTSEAVAELRIREGAEPTPTATPSPTAAATPTPTSTP